MRKKEYNTMTLKMYQILDFPTFFTKVKSSKLPFKTSYKLTVLAQEIEKHTAFYQEKFRETLMEYGMKDEQGNLVPTEDGQGIRLIEETMDEAYTKLTELRELDVELPTAKFSPDDFDDIELSPEEMVAIMPFIGE
jgi:hypothetical protein